MAEKYIQLKVISKDGIRFNGVVSSVVLPSITGEITILPDHISLLSGLKKGVIKVLPVSGGQKSLDIASGFARFIGNECIITVEEIAKVS